MAAAVARQEYQRLPIQLGPHDRVGRRAERRVQPVPADVLEARDVVDPAAADDADDRRLMDGHRRIPCWRAVSPAALRADTAAGTRVSDTPPRPSTAERRVGKTGGSKL